MNINIQLLNLVTVIIIWPYTITQISLSVYNKIIYKPPQWGGDDGDKRISKAVEYFKCLIHFLP